MAKNKEVSLPVAAFQLGASYEVARRLLFRGELDGRQDDTGRWKVSTESVERLLAARGQPSPTAA